MIVELLPSQDEFIFSKDRHPAIIGGLGSGKTQGGILRLLKLIMEDKGTHGAYYLPTYDLIRLRAMPGFEQALSSWGIPFKTNQSNHTIAIQGYGDIYFRSYERPDKIVSFEVAHSIIDEIDTIKLESAELVWRKIVERNRQNTTVLPNSIGCVTTPDQGYNGFIYKKWFKEKKEGYSVIEASTYDNPFLPPEYVRNILDNYDPILADLYLRGKIVSLNQNKVYHFFSRTKHHTDRELTDSDTNIYISIDFNVGGCASGVHIIESGWPVTVEEFTSFDTYDFLNNIAKYKGRNITIYPDASGNASRTNASRSDIQIIRDAGYFVDAPNMNPPIRDRVNSVNSLLAHGRYKINTNKCPNTTNALEIQGYKNGEPEKFDKHPAVDDFTDNLGYFIHRRWGVDRNMFTTTEFAMR